ncbi:MAG: hypothetical protein K8F91_01150 [Candidatus Obscuribacterales bacterium]|nr:hypothetical protein [Candidatus Obscuribacterales bacterium]
MALGVRWGFIDKTDFEFEDLLDVFEAYDICTAEFGDLLKKIEYRSSYRLNRKYGLHIPEKQSP